MADLAKEESAKEVAVKAGRLAAKARGPGYSAGARDLTMRSRLPAVRPVRVRMRDPD